MLLSCLPYFILYLESKVSEWCDGLGPVGHLCVDMALVHSVCSFPVVHLWEQGVHLPLLRCEVPASGLWRQMPCDMSHSQVHTGVSSPGGQVMATVAGRLLWEGSGQHSSKIL